MSESTLTGEAINRARMFSDKKLNQLRAALESKLDGASIAITCGSYARREASNESDLDYLIVRDDVDDKQNCENIEDILKETIQPIVQLEPAEDGAFAKVIPKSQLLSEIGGSKDDNRNITRRMLLLLEGDWLAEQGKFQELRRDIIEIYVKKTPKDHQLALFLLNDVIRYWRTMTVDYENKTSKEVDPKPWPVRNIKLGFSRKLMYAGGLFAVGLTADRTERAKIELLENLFNIPVIERMIHICGQSRMTKALESYNIFLEGIESSEKRKHLNGLDRETAPDDEDFRSLKNESHRFTLELLSVFEKTFHSNHPIRRAVIF